MFKLLDTYLDKVQPVDLNFLFEVAGWMELHKKHNKSSHMKNKTTNQTRSRAFARDTERSIIYESIVEYFIEKKTFHNRPRKS